jgi:hypothetical protein
MWDILPFIGFIAALTAWTAYIAWDSHNHGMDAGRDEAEIEAVKEGVAEYYIDADNERAFRWKKNQ